MNLVHRGDFGIGELFHPPLYLVVLDDIFENLFV